MAASSSHSDATERIQALAALSQTLAEASLDLQRVLDHVTRRVAELIGDSCVVRFLSDDGQWLTLASYYHADPQLRALTEQVLTTLAQRADEGYSATVLATGQALLVPVVDQQELRSVMSPEYWPYFDRLSIQSLLLAPLRARGRVFGTIRLTRYSPGQPYTAEDQSFLVELAERAALAIDHALLYAAERAARAASERNARQLARLQAITAALSEAHTPVQVAEAMIGEGLAAFGADAGSVYRLVDGGQTLELLASAGYPEELRERHARVDAGLPGPLRDALQQGETITVESPEELVARWPRLAQAQAQSSDAAAAAVPLLIDERPLGVMYVVFRRPRSFDAEDRALLATLGRLCSQALDRARLFLEAQEAVRARDVFFSVAAHELRTPLTALLGQAQLLQRRADRDQHLTERDRRSISVIAGQAMRLNTMITALLDVARLAQGRLSLEVAPFDLGALVQRVTEELRPTIESHTLVCAIDPAPALVSGDAMRLEQVLHNLIDNAVKYSPEGGLIEVAVSRAEGSVQISVRDTGVGIPPQEIPHLFERFYRARAASEHHIAGMGVGLFVVREIILLHGGSVTVESVVDQGSTFIVTLPLAAEQPEGD